MDFIELYIQCDDNKVEVLSKAMTLMEEKLSHCPGKLHLDFFSQVNFIGLFVKDQHYDFLMNITDEFSAEIRKSGKIMTTVDILDTG